MIANGVLVDGGHAIHGAGSQQGVIHMWKYFSPPLLQLVRLCDGPVGPNNKQADADDGKGDMSIFDNKVHVVVSFLSKLRPKKFWLDLTGSYD